MAMNATDLGNEINAAIEKKKFDQILPIPNAQHPAGPITQNGNVVYAGPAIHTGSVMSLDPAQAQADMSNAIAAAVIAHIIKNMEIDLSKNSITVTIPTLLVTQGAGTASKPNTNPIPLTDVKGTLSAGIS